MRIGVDLDGVCYEFQRTYRYMLRQEFDINIPPVKDFWTEWNACDQYTTKAQRGWMWGKGVEQGLFRYGHMVTGARIGLQALHDAGHKLVIVTTRPANAVSDTLDWVSLYFKGIPLDGLHILSQGESKASVTGDLLIDDKPENVSEWAQVVPRQAILFDQPWNQDAFTDFGVIRAKGWGEVVKTVAALTADRSSHR